VQLQAALEAFVAEARGTGLVAAVIVNGSFASGQAQPGDIDLVVVLRGDVDLSAELRPDQYNVLSAKRVRSRYPFDVLFVTSAPETLQPAINFFAR
jgi:predicted nucleotidyltransferase